MVAVPSQVMDALSFLFGRWADAGVNSGDRFDKWAVLLRYLVDNPHLLVFGAGFGSPNDLVLGRDLGNILAVDNGYVRRIFESGVIGVLIYFGYLFCLSFFLAARRALRPGLALVVLFLVAALTVEATQVTQTAGIFHLLVGSLIGLNARARVDAEQATLGMLEVG